MNPSGASSLLTRFQVTPLLLQLHQLTVDAALRHICVTSLTDWTICRLTSGQLLSQNLLIHRLTGTVLHGQPLPLTVHKQPILVGNGWSLQNPAQKGFWLDLSHRLRQCGHNSTASRKGT